MRPSKTERAAKATAERADLIAALRRLPFLTVDDVALITDLHPLTIYRLCRSGELAGVRVGRNWRVRPEAIDQWLTPPPTRRNLERVG